MYWLFDTLVRAIVGALEFVFVMAATASFRRSYIHQRLSRHGLGQVRRLEKQDARGYFWCGCTAAVLAALSDTFKPAFSAGVPF